MNIVTATGTLFIADLFRIIIIISSSSSYALRNESRRCDAMRGKCVSSLSLAPRSNPMWLQRNKSQLYSQIYIYIHAEQCNSLLLTELERWRRRRQRRRRRECQGTAHVLQHHIILPIVKLGLVWCNEIQCRMKKKKNLILHSQATTNQHDENNKPNRRLNKTMQTIISSIHFHFFFVHFF